MLQDYYEKCMYESPQACHDYIGYVSNLEDNDAYKDEYTHHKWGQLFGRVEYYSRDNLDSLVGLKQEVKNQFQNGITYFRKWGDRLFNGTIRWNQGRNCVTKKNESSSMATSAVYSLSLILITEPTRRNDIS